MSAPSENDVWTALADFQDPETGRNAVQQGQLRDVVVAADRVGVTLALTTHSAPLKDDARREVEALAASQVPRRAEHRSAARRCTNGRRCRSARSA